ncbi:MAG TPA: 4-(cytidine 5'-diphospho)-2-C-methyl-D-erythritol kinase [Candidatus Saccharimonadales bacterium]|nr:4-(cytidine 5'-diphospho)-2-C-methyl-D-erythritol kinase [Candidatus Saccharimonadales bacterium]
MTGGRRVVARVPAKLNLHLEVLGRRPDGFHEIRSLFQAVSLYDRLELSATRGELELRVLPRGLEGVSEGPENLVLRALEELRRAFRVRAGARARLWKRIPVGAGLGGGSADAAMALVAGARLWRLRPAPARLRALARRLGADVPFFLGGGAAWMGGRGDRVLRRGRLPDFRAVVAYPGYPVSTREAYAGLEIPLTRAWRVPSIPHYSFAPCAGAHVVYQGTNAFEPWLRRRHPRIGALARLLAGAGARGVRVTGSGSAVFGVVPDTRSARALNLRVRRAGSWAWIVRPVGGGVELL